MVFIDIPAELIHMNYTRLRYRRYFPGIRSQVLHIKKPINAYVRSATCSNIFASSEDIGISNYLYQLHPKWMWCITECCTNSTHVWVIGMERNWRAFEIIYEQSCPAAMHSPKKDLINATESTFKIAHNNPAPYCMLISFGRGEKQTKKRKVSPPPKKNRNLDVIGRGL